MKRQKKLTNGENMTRQKKLTNGENMTRQKKLSKLCLMQQRMNRLANDEQLDVLIAELKKEMKEVSLKLLESQDSDEKLKGQKLQNFLNQES
jgi:hypothetical protein